MNYAMYYLPNILFSVMEGDLVKLKEKVKELDGIIDNMEGNKEVTVHQKMELSSVLVHLAQKEN